MIEFILHLSPGIWVALIVLSFIGLVSQMSLYAKAGQPAISALVPVWNLMVFCKVVGRPVMHSLFLIVPGTIIAIIFAIYIGEFDSHFPTYDALTGDQIPGHGTIGDLAVPLSVIGACMIPIIVFMIYMFIEVCDSFGKHSTTDKVLCVVFNGFYVLFVLGVSEALYEAPWWRKKRGLPYYIPDHKHKGKRILVTPDGPLVGDPRNQKLKMEIVDTEEAAAKANANSSPKKEVKSNSSIKKDKKEAAKPDSKSEEKKTVDPKVATKTESSKKEDAPKKEDTATKADDKTDSPIKKPVDTGRQKIGDVLERYKKSDPKPKSDGKSWQDEIKEKYKKKK